MERKYKLNKEDIWILNSLLDSNYDYEVFTDEFIEENFGNKYFYIIDGSKIVCDIGFLFEESKLNTIYENISLSKIIERFGVKILDVIIEKTFVKIK